MRYFSSGNLGKPVSFATEIIRSRKTHQYCAHNLAVLHFAFTWIARSMTASTASHSASRAE